MTYAELALLFLAAGAVLAATASVVAHTGRTWWTATLAVGALLLVLTAVFDTAMIAADIFRYDDTALLGARVLRVPVEDFAWPVFAVLALPALWELAGHVGKRRVRR